MRTFQPVVTLLWDGIQQESDHGPSITAFPQRWPKTVTSRQLAFRADSTGVKDCRWDDIPTYDGQPLLDSGHPVLFYETTQYLEYFSGAADYCATLTVGATPHTATVSEYPQGLYTSFRLTLRKSACYRAPPS